MQKKVIYGGWWIKDWIDRRVVARIKCQAPNWSLYLENVEARRGAVR